VGITARPVVLGDGDRILQIVTNLITNALNATPVGGDVTLDITVGARVGQVIVSDTGPGIPAQDRAAILRPFVTSSVRHGIGLGLPVSSELAQAMGGTLVVGDRPGGGAAFTLSLPLAAGPHGIESPEPASELVAE
jgi:signal transduction histidine kinase